MHRTNTMRESRLEMDDNSEKSFIRFTSAPVLTFNYVL